MQLGKRKEANKKNQPRRLLQINAYYLLPVITNKVVY